MIRRCLVCNSSFDKEYNKAFDLVPDVCREECLADLLKQQAEIDCYMEWITQREYEYKSSYEEKFAKWLKKNGMPFLYEPVLLGGNYIPDFLILPRSVIIEVKGIWEKGALKKTRDAWKKVGEVRPLYVIPRDILRRLHA